MNKLNFPSSTWRLVWHWLEIEPWLHNELFTLIITRQWTFISHEVFFLSKNGKFQGGIQEGNLTIYLYPQSGEHKSPIIIMHQLTNWHWIRTYLQWAHDAITKSGVLFNRRIDVVEVDGLWWYHLTFREDGESTS